MKYLHKTLLTKTYTLESILWVYLGHQSDIANKLELSFYVRIFQCVSINLILASIFNNMIVFIGWFSNPIDVSNYDSILSFSESISLKSTHDHVYTLHTHAHAHAYAIIHIVCMLTRTPTRTHTHIRITRK